MVFKSPLIPFQHVIVFQPVKFKELDLLGVMLAVHALSYVYLILVTLK